MNAMEGGPQSLAAGRCCPLDYLTPLQGFRRPAELLADTLYVAGGLYGNPFALTSIKELVEQDSGAKLVFNGDCHWFDRDLSLFSTIEAELSPYFLLRGNVETEMARAGDIGAGCGCAYPAYIDQGVVDRSNRMLVELTRMIAGEEAHRAALAARAATLIAEIGGMRIGIVHGDAHSLAGWSFDPPQLDDGRLSEDRRRVHAETGLSLFASTHTGTAALRHYESGGDGFTIVNNGSAGLPNFSGRHFGIITRIATTPAPLHRLYGIRHGALYVDAIAVHYDHPRFLALFDALWPQGSDAEIGYRNRILSGPAHDILTAAGKV